jgi:hypothetical protein
MTEYYGRPISPFFIEPENLLLPSQQSTSGPFLSQFNPVHKDISFLL